MIRKRFALRADSRLQPVFQHEAGNAGKFVRVVGDEDSARRPGDGGDPEIGLADDGTRLFKRASDVHIVFHCLAVRPRDGKWLEDLLHLTCVMCRSGALGCSEFQLGQHLEGNENFIWRLPEKFLPDRVGTSPKAGDEDIRVDETGHYDPLSRGSTAEGRILSGARKDGSSMEPKVAIHSAE